MGDKMYWYIAHVKTGQANKLVSSLNKQENIEAFIPKKEQWYRARDKRTYVIKELYPDYVFIKSKLNKDEFDKKFKVFFRTIKGLIELLDYQDIYPLTLDEQSFLEKLFDGGYVIKHTLGNIINSRFNAIKGPLIGLEDKIIKLNRHDRFVTLDCTIFNGKFNVAIEMVD